MSQRHRKDTFIVRLKCDSVLNAEKRIPDADRRVFPPLLYLVCRTQPYKRYKQVIFDQILQACGFFATNIRRMCVEWYAPCIFIIDEKATIVATCGTLFNLTVHPGIHSSPAPHPSSSTS